MPKYWKKNGKRELRIIIRNDCYRLDDRYLYLPKRLKLRWKGCLKWHVNREGLKLFMMMLIGCGGAL